MNEALSAADALLKEIGQIERSLQETERLVQTSIENVRQTYAGLLQEHRADLGEKAKALRKFMKANKADIFAADDRVDLDNGALLMHVTRRVKRIRDMVARLEGQGLTGAIRIAKTANWDEIEKWDDEKLALVGTERVEKEKFEYELKP